MVLLTVIGRKLAKPGMQFIFIGPNSNCKECKVKTICFHLKHGARYKIISARDVVHDCQEHEDNVVIVEVEEVPRQSVIPKKIAMEGTTITLDIPKCKERGCQHYQLCLPVGLETGYKRQILSVTEKIECLDGQDRVKVILS